MKNNNEQLATIEDTDFKVMLPESSEAMEAVKDNLRGARLSRFDLVKIKVPGAGVTDWTLEEVDGNRLASTFTGIILHWHNARQYYKDTEKQSDDPPDCASDDAITGNPFGSCIQCQYSEWKSAKKGKGQACRLKRVLYILQPNAYLPTVLECPPTSYSSAMKYFIFLSQMGISSANIVTEFSLVGNQSDDGFKYAQVVFKKERTLTPEEKTFSRSYGDTFKNSLQG